MASRSVTSGTPLVITNAIYFKGAWQHAFKPEQTHDEDFHLLDSTETRKVKMMSQNKLKARHRNFDEHAMIQLPYKGNDIVMLVMLPHENKAASLDAVRLSPLLCWNQSESQTI